MNRTEAVKAHKLSASMVDALTGAAFREHATGNGEAGYVIHDMHPRTRKALHDRGLMYGHYYLTRKGIETLASLAGNVVDLNGYVWEGDKLIPAVEIQGDEPSNWTPDFLAQGARECYYGCGNDVVAVFVTDVGVTEGLCKGHRERVQRPTVELPTAHTVAPQILAHARQSTGKDVTTGERVDNSEAMAELMDSMEDDSMTEATVIIPGTHALDMGSKSYNRFVAVGESGSVPGSLFTYGLATAISAHPGMNGTGKLNIPCEFGDVITVRTSLGDVRYVVEDNRYSATGPRKGDPILTPYTTDDARCYVCETHGDNSMHGQNIDGEWVCGYCVANNRTPAKLNSHTLSLYVVTENAGTKFECKGNCGSISLRSFFGEFECERDDSDAGFVETDSVEDVSLSTTSTGTTHHSVDSQGGEWVRFDHVLTVGDVVKITGTQGVYEVYALIPGLPVVYVLGTTGEPFPVGATKLYAL